MTSTDIQGLLRFLSGPAKLPLREAMGKAKPLLSDGLSSPDAIAKASLDRLLKIFPDEKTAKQVLSAAKRATNTSSGSKKRSASTAAEGSSTSTGETPRSPSKRRKQSSVPSIDSANPQSWEVGLDLPAPTRDETLISGASLTTNRAPLLLAFAVVSLGYTHPWLPMSSRFSLAQGLLELTAASKAKNLGITREDGGKDEELGEGYKRIRVLGKEIPVLRRWDTVGVDTGSVIEVETGAEKQGAEQRDDGNSKNSGDVKSTTSAGINPEGSASIVGGEHSSTSASTAGERDTSVAGSSTSTLAPGTGAAPVSYDGPVYWALSPKLLSQPPAASKQNPSALPIQLPHAAHSYLVRSFSAEMLPLLLGALHSVYGSWANSVTPMELDRRGWGWYCRVRPSVEDGPEGWGGKGFVKLEDVLALRKGGVKETKTTEDYST
ncbi:hypothetical protein H072_9875 [Dactylellina haptotyla CBS 200.50]|uniref:Uncharacterized protein n=1 Tax=Dactylellina haptotyla (strain CBS 200.50) TaxID=1284197 RepID=S8A623_DACHA|nr:hypothetical protein H072_9875 [Dactylellina haptotyla CBS 200.50]